VTLYTLNSGCVEPIERRILRRVRAVESHVSNGPRGTKILKKFVHQTDDRERGDAVEPGPRKGPADTTAKPITSTVGVVPKVDRNA